MGTLDGEFLSVGSSDKFQTMAQSFRKIVDIGDVVLEQGLKQL